MTATLQPFSKDNTCPKCDDDDVSVMHRPGIAGEVPEHLELECNCCGYCWAMACKDADA